MLLNSCQVLLHCRISWIRNHHFVNYCGRYGCRGYRKRPASSCHLWRVSSQLNFWANISIFTYFIFICIQLNSLYIYNWYISCLMFQVFNCYGTFAICPWRYPLYDMADHWLSATFCNPQLIILGYMHVFTSRSSFFFVWCLFPGCNHDYVLCISSVVYFGFENLLFCWKANTQNIKS